MTPADILDICAFTAVAIGCLIGLIRGLSGELANIFAMGAAYLACRILGSPWRAFCSEVGQGSRILAVLLTTVGFLAMAIFAAWLVRKGVDKCLRVLLPQPLNSLLGGTFGAVAAFLLTALVCLLLHLLPFSYIQKSILEPARFWSLAKPLVSLTHGSY